MTMDWNSSHDMLLASHDCTRCHGVGHRPGRKGQALSCSCVLRNIFRACFRRFRECAESETSLRGVTLERSSGQLRRCFYGRKKEEYLADFYLIARRTLTGEEFTMFKYYYLYGANWKLCMRQFGMERGPFFHTVYRIQQKLGATFRDIRPYPLFPLDDYFDNAGRLSVDELRTTVRTVNEGEDERGPLTPPVRRAA